MLNGSLMVHCIISLWFEVWRPCLKVQSKFLQRTFTRRQVFWHSDRRKEFRVGIGDVRPIIEAIHRVV